MEKNSKYISICIGRQLGSGGRDIAHLLAEDFNATFYDRELMNLAAKESGFSEKFFEQNDEKRGLFQTLFHMHAPHIADNNLYANNFSQESLFKFQSDAIVKAAEEGSCVFVGRCADYVLREHSNMVSVFVTAPLEYRIKRVMEKSQMDAAQARKFIEQREASRAAYYNYYTGKKWGAAESYDLCIDTSRLGLQETGKLIAEYIRKRFKL